jgi:hypothetical protein
VVPPWSAREHSGGRLSNMSTAGRNVKRGPSISPTASATGPTPPKILASTVQTIGRDL